MIGQLRGAGRKIRWENRNEREEGTRQAKTQPLNTTTHALTLTLHCATHFDNQPEVATANVRNLGSKEVQGYQVSKALDVAHAHICEEAAIQVELGEAGEARQLLQPSVSHPCTHTAQQKLNIRANKNRNK